MEIITIKDAKGATLEKRVLTSVSINTNSGEVILQGARTITRIDGTEVVAESMTGINVQPAGSQILGSADLTAAQIIEVMAAKDQFLTKIKTIIEIKATA
ncbi:hypothetical protein H7F33_14245 [Pedobacter sp. PAMC26386]|nr:hypothetical protein H7F33_14245 [Pedobacter sp. PAMC26386]